MYDKAHQSIEDRDETSEIHHRHQGIRENRDRDGDADSDGLTIYHDYLPMLKRTPDLEGARPDIRFVHSYQ
jgi:hypothetical protein